VEIREIVRHDALWFASVCSPGTLAPFQHYVSRLMLAENTTVDGINRVTALSRRQTWGEVMQPLIEAVGDEPIAWSPPTATGCA